MRVMRALTTICVLSQFVPSVRSQTMDIEGIAEQVQIRLTAPDSAFNARSLLELARQDTSGKVAFRDLRTSSHRFHGHLDMSRWRKYGTKGSEVEWYGRYVVAGDSSYSVVDSVRCKGIFRHRHRKRSYFIEDQLRELLGPYSWLCARPLPVAPEKRHRGNSSTAKTQEKIKLMLESQFAVGSRRTGPRFWELYDSTAVKNFGFAITDDGCYGCNEASYCLEVRPGPEGYKGWKKMSWYGRGDFCVNQKTRMAMSENWYFRFGKLDTSFRTDSRSRNGTVVHRYLYWDGSLPVGGLTREHFTFALNIGD